MSDTSPVIPLPASPAVPARHEIRSVQQTTCCIVGAGPGGAILALLLARQGIQITLLEAHADFDREFRGDTIHPSVMEILDQLGLADRLLELPHTKIRTASIETATGPVTVGDFRRLKTRFPYIVLMPQARFLEFITEEAKRYPAFHLVMRAVVRELVEENGADGAATIRGVRYSGPDGWHEVRAHLTVAADGRSSTVRRLAGFVPIATSPPMDILWFRLPTLPGEPIITGGRFGHGRALVLLPRGDYWQVGYVIPKGTYQHLRTAGLEALCRSIAEIAPEFAESLETITEWKQVSLLSVESSRLLRWHRPGLLLIGDAAHVMSPVGGVGINLAIQDAVVAANVLTRPLLAGRVRERDLSAVQRQREWQTRLIQAIQTAVQNQIVAGVFDSDRQFRMPLVLRLPVIRDLPARLLAFGVWPVHVRSELATVNAGMSA